MSKANTAAPVVVTTPLNNVPAALWKRAEKAAKACGQTMDEFTREAVQEKLNPKPFTRSGSKKLLRAILANKNEARGKFRLFALEHDVEFTTDGKGRFWGNGLPLTQAELVQMWVYLELNLADAGGGIFDYDCRRLFDIVAREIGGVR